MTKPKEKAVPTNGRRARGGVRDIRITDVAALAQVSPITVSRALNNPEVVAPETLRRIQQTVQQLGYVPNRLAGSLSSSKSRLIAAIVPTVAHSLFATSIQTFSDAMSRAGYQVLLGLAGYSEDDELRVLDAALSRRPEGVLLVAELLERQRAYVLDERVGEAGDLLHLPDAGMPFGRVHEATHRENREVESARPADCSRMMSSPDSTRPPMPAKLSRIRA